MKNPVKDSWLAWLKNLDPETKSVDAWLSTFDGCIIFKDWESVDAHLQRGGKLANYDGKNAAEMPERCTEGPTIDWTIISALVHCGPTAQIAEYHRQIAPFLRGK